MTTSTLKRIAPALAAAGIASAAAGYYFYGSKDAKKHRAHAAKWAQDLKSGVVQQARRLGTLDKAAVLSLVDTAAESYKSIRSINRSDIENAAQELKRNWQLLIKEAGIAPAKKGRRSSKRSTSRARAK